MKYLLYSAVLFLLHTTVCSLSAQKVAEYRWGERRYSDLKWVWELPDGQLAVIGSTLKNQDTLTTWKLLHMKTDGTVTAEMFLPTGGDNAVPSQDGTTFWWDASFSQQGRHIRYLVSAATGQLLDSSVFKNAALINGYGVTSQAQPDGGRVLLYGVKNGFDGEMHIVRLGPSGNVLFDKAVNSDYSPWVNPSRLLVLPSGRICLTHTNASGEDELLCYNPEGFLLWRRKLPDGALLYGQTFMVHLGNNRVAFIAERTEAISYGYAVGFNAGGSLAWERLDLVQEVPDFQVDRCFSDNGHLVLSGQYYLPNELGTAVVKLALDGKTIFAHRYPALGSDFMLSRMLRNGNYLFSGFTWKPIMGGFQSDKAFFLSLSPDGSTRWLLTSDSFSMGHVVDFCEMKDRSIALVGNGPDGMPGLQSGLQGLLFYLSPTVSVASPVAAESIIEAFPNPAVEGMVWLHSRNPDQTIQQVYVYATDGRELSRLQPNEALLQVPLPAERGAYWLRVQTNDGDVQVIQVLRQ